jgi:hypothetical protein
LKITSLIVFVLSFFTSTVLQIITIQYDPQDLFNAAISFAKNDYLYMHKEYLLNHTYQLGMVLYEEIIFRLFPFNKNIQIYILVILTCIMITVAYLYLYKIVQILFKKDSITKIYSLMYILCIQVHLHGATFYPIIPMLCFSAISAYYLISYLQTDKTAHIIISVLTIAISYSFKANTIIIIIAYICIILAHYIKNCSFNIKKLIFAISALIVIYFAAKVPLYVYQIRTGVPVSNSKIYTMPKIVYINMGTKDYIFISNTHCGVLDNGQYHSYGSWTGESLATGPNNVLTNSKEDIENRSKQDIQNSIKYFAAHPKQALNFIKNKYLLQWGSSSYNVFPLDPPMHTLAKYYMPGYKLLIAVFSFVGLICLRNTKKIQIFLLPLIITGGTAFHFISEAQDEYAFIYFVFMLPTAAYGLYKFYESFDNKTLIKLKI